MKLQALKQFRSKLANRETVSGLWVTLESATITEMAVAMGLDWVTIDAEHGHLDWKDILDHVRATVRSDTVCLVRVAERNAGLVKRALDIGADGVVIPWMETADQLREARDMARYPPNGIRGIGAERATCWGQCFTEHAATADEEILVVPLIESVKGAENIDRLLQVEGVDTYFFGPADFSATAGYPGEWEGPGVADAIRTAATKIQRAGKHTGVITTSTEDFRRREQEGFRMLGLGLDAGLLIRQLRSSLDDIGRSSAITADFAPSLERDWVAQSKLIPVKNPPEHFRPDRPEVMNPVGSGEQFEMDPGVSFECLVGPHNRAEGISTGIVRFSPGSAVPYHTHTFSESVTVLEGKLTVEVEGRRYQLNKLDNITIPAGARHMAICGQRDGGCLAHGMMATTRPSRTLCEAPVSRRSMPDDAAGLIGPEHVVRFKTAERYEAGPNTAFIDFFNARMIPGFAMSGGYGLFHHKGRLPAHLHDFDESITIITGKATCNVEGRRYTMSDRATALQPRGRIHYFINDTHEPMEMLWVYAGSLPERIEIDESLTSPDARPWG